MSEDDEFLKSLRGRDPEEVKLLILSGNWPTKRIAATLAWLGARRAEHDATAKWENIRDAVAAIAAIIAAVAAIVGALISYLAWRYPT